MTLPDNLDSRFTVYPRKIEGSDNVHIVLELGGVDGIPEDVALDTIRYFDQMLPMVLGTFMDVIYDAERNRDD